MSQAYRADISGLRALAVLPVLLFHLGVPFLGGGFVGVDVFFVISGYVIALSVYGHLESGPRGAFRFLGWFYERRARRILPALLFVSALTFIAAYTLFLPDRFIDFAWSLLASAALSANIYFWLTSDYFAAAAHTQPLLHYWSLGVEEHFYLVFPVLILALWRFGMRVIGVVLVVALVASLVAAQASLKSMPDGVFYLIQFRAWELLCGSVLALPAIRAPRSAWTAVPAAVVGAALLAWSIRFTEESSFPGVAALPACLAAVLLIWAGQRHNPVSAAIGTTPLEYIGKISYSLYLVHWPVIVFARHLSPDISTGDLVLVGLPLSMLLAMFSYHFIEQPTRNRTGIWTPGVIAGFSGVGLAVAAGFAVIVIRSEGFVARLPADVQALVNYKSSHVADYRPPCFIPAWKTVEALNRELCLPDGEKVALLWGDSHAAHYVVGLKPRLEELGYTFAQANSPACAPILNRDVPTKPNCREFNDTILAWIEQKKPALVIMSALWPTDATSLSLLKASLTEFAQKTSTQFVILGPSPLYLDNVPTILAERRLRGEMSDLSLRDVRRTFHLEKAFKTFVMQQRAVGYISVLDIACPDGNCRIKGKGPLHWDHAHLTAEGSRYFVDAILPELLRVLAATSQPSS